MYHVIRDHSQQAWRVWDNWLNEPVVNCESMSRVFMDIRSAKRAADLMNRLCPPRAGEDS